jgi:hypothetical protein
MIRIVFSFVIFFHGLVHLLGFVKEWNLAQVKQLTGETLISLSGGLSKIVGIIWLIAGLLFILSAVTYSLRKEWWWMVAAIAIVVSQILIIIYWKDARFGTVANVIILIACVLSYGSWSFDRMVNDELNSFLPEKEIEERVVTAEMIDELPLVVQKWLKRSNIVGKEIIQIAHLKQKGEMKTKPESNWMSVDAEQYITANPPGFIWIADVKAAPFLHLSGRDKYENGRGHMLIKLFSLIPVVDARGKEIDQGALLRYLGEIVWVPSAALSDYITWEEINSTTAKATMSYGGITASGIFKFDENGDFVSFEAKRYYYRKEGPTLERWVITVNGKSYREFEGIRVPVNLSVTWKFETGDFTWYRLEITEVEYNKW